MVPTVPQPLEKADRFGSAPPPRYVRGSAPAFPLEIKPNPAPGPHPLPSRMSGDLESVAPKPDVLEYTGPTVQHGSPRDYAILCSAAEVTLG